LKYKLEVIASNGYLLGYWKTIIKYFKGFDMRKLSIFLGGLLWCLGGLAQNYDSLNTAFASISSDMEKVETILNYYDQHEKKHDYVNSVRLLNEALNISEKKHLKSLEASAYYKLGTLEANEEKHADALKYLQKALSFFEEQNDRLMMGRTLIKIGNVYDRQETLDEATKIYNQAKELGSKYRIPEILGYAYNSLGIIADKQGKSHLALDYGLKALPLLKKANLNEEYISGLINVGVHYKNLHQYNNAIEQYRKALSSIGPDDTFSQSAIYINMAWALLGKKDFDKGIESALTGIQLANNIQERKYFQADAYDVLSRLYENQGDFEKSLQAHKKQTALNDSIRNEDVSQRIAELQTKYENDKKEHQISNLYQENQIKMVFLVVAAILIGILVFFGLVSFKQKRLIEQKNELLIVQNAKIQEQADKLKLMMKELHHRVKNNLSIVSSLLNLQTYGLKDDNAIRAVQTGQRRVEAMSLIHQKLYQTEHITTINMREYIVDLVENIMDSYGYDRDNFTLNLEVVQEEVDVDLGIPLGLILNELITNAFKYAYQGIQKPSLSISFKVGDGITLNVADNGIGIDLAKWNQKGVSFGKQLIVSLSKQVSGTYHIHNQNGTIFTLYIPKDQLKIAS
jgi:two-component sensor histidine kinase